MTVAGSDAWADAPLIEMGQASPVFTISNYTVAPDEPQTYAQYTAWWKVIPSIDGFLYVDTLASPNHEAENTDTVLDIFTGDSLATLQRIGYEDNSPERWDNVEHLTVPVQAGITYYVRMGAYKYHERPIQVVLQTKRGEWGPWQEVPDFTGTITLSPEQTFVNLPDGAGQVRLQVYGSSRGYTDTIKDGTNRTQNIWDLIRGVTDTFAGQPANAQGGGEQLMPPGPWGAGAMIQGSTAPSSYEFVASGAMASVSILDAHIYLDALNPTRNARLPAETNGDATWSLTITPNYTQHVLTALEPAYQEQRNLVYRVHDMPYAVHPYWYPDQGGRTYPRDYLDPTDGTGPIQANLTGWTQGKFLTLFPDMLYDPAFPSVSKRDTWWSATDLSFTVAVTVNRPAWREVVLTESTTPPPEPPPVEPPKGPLALQPGITGSMGTRRRQFNAAH